MHNQNRLYEFVIITAIISLASWFYFHNLDIVPFHPDEATQIFMSTDVDQFIDNPMSLAWRPVDSPDPRLRYRLIDAPLTRTVIGVARKIAGYPSLPQDWNWSENWQFNQASGAMPSNSLLRLARLSVAVFFPFTLLFLYCAVRETFNSLTAFVAILLFASHALILLHTRRAMAESLLVFNVCLSLFSLVKFTKKPWLSAFPIALAINAKQSALPLILVGLLAILTYSALNKKGVKAIAIEILYYGAIIFSIYLLLNPVLWRFPLQAFQESWMIRSELTRQQVYTLQSVDGQKVLLSISQKLAGLIGNLFVTSPAIEDVGNYTNELRGASQVYFTTFIHNLFRGFAGGAVFLILTLMGFFQSVRNLTNSSPEKTKKVWIFLTASMLQLIANFSLSSLPFQRYVITLVPYTCAWCAVGVASLINTFSILAADRKKRLLS
jgi:4-amino-4-deoxy-L-arabinose transferase-like glycosyltransferase